MPVDVLAMSVTSAAEQAAVVGGTRPSMGLGVKRRQPLLPAEQAASYAFANPNPGPRGPCFGPANALALRARPGAVATGTVRVRQRPDEPGLNVARGGTGRGAERAGPSAVPPRPPPP